MHDLEHTALTDEERSAVQGAAAMLRERFPVERIVLFGSKARGQVNDESDVDLLVLTSRRISPEEKSRMRRELFDLQVAHTVVIDAIITSAEEWDRGLYQVLPLHDEVERDGVPA